MGFPAALVYTQVGYGLLLLANPEALMTRATATEPVPPWALAVVAMLSVQLGRVPTIMRVRAG